MDVMDSRGYPVPLERIMDAKVPVAEYIWVDQHVARVMAARNIEPKKGLKGTNRRTAPAVAGKYMRSMLDDLWLPTNQGIGFNVNGEMMDAAHRIKGLLQAAEINPDIKILTLVCGGLPVEAKRVIDDGRKRTRQQKMQMEGAVNTFDLTATLRLIWMYDNEPWQGTKHWELKAEFPEHVMFDLWEKTPEIDEYVNAGRRMKKWMKASAAAAALYLTERDCPDGNASIFMERLRDGLALTENDAVYRLRHYFSFGEGQYLTRVEQLAHWIKAFNKNLIGEKYEPHFRSGELDFPRIRTDYVRPDPEDTEQF